MTDAKRIGSMIIKYALLIAIFVCTVYISSHSDRESDMGEEDTYLLDVTLTTAANLTAGQKGIVVKYDIREAFLTFPLSRDGLDDTVTDDNPNADLDTAFTIMFSVFIVAAFLSELYMVLSDKGRTTSAAVGVASAILFFVTLLFAFIVILSLLRTTVNPSVSGLGNTQGACGGGTLAANSMLHAMKFAGAELSTRASKAATSAFGSPAHNALAQQFVSDVNFMSTAQRKNAPECYKGLTTTGSVEYNVIGKFQDNIAYIKQHPTFAIAPGIIGILKQVSGTNTNPLSKQISYWWGSTLVTMNPTDVHNLYSDYNDLTTTAATWLAILLSILAIYFMVDGFVIADLKGVASNTKLPKIWEHVRYGWMSFTCLLGLGGFIHLINEFEGNRESQTTTFRSTVWVTFICQLIVWIITIIGLVYAYMNKAQYNLQRLIAVSIWIGFLCVHVSFAIVFVYHVHYMADPQTTQSLPADVSNALVMFTFLSLVPIIIHGIMIAYPHRHKIDDSGTSIVG